jgi:peptidoglycan/xylan/chitin deacetylase (PgdA/CDA1 family)
MKIQLRSFKLLFLLTSVLLGACSSYPSKDMSQTEDYSTPLKNVVTDEKVVAITFDDGPEELSLKLIELLDAADAKATFFVVGNKMESERNVEILRQVAAAGHEIANHTYTHPHMSQLSAEENAAQIRKTQEIIASVLGEEPTLFRAPYLDFNDEVSAILGEEKLLHIFASNSVRDWDEATTVDDIIERGARTVQPGGIVLMHSWSEKTYAALPEVIRILKEKGYRLVTVSELLEYRSGY